jgi:polysaccharide deacetylase 2 family uncharacterized protein YibQ
MVPESTDLQTNLPADPPISAQPHPEPASAGGPSSAQPPVSLVNLPTNSAPAIAIVIDDLGYSDAAARRIMAWSEPVTVSILTYGRNIEDIIASARASGHGVLLHLPMEPDGSEDPGPVPLLTSLSEAELRHRIEWNFSQLSDFDGVNNHMGSRFTRDRRALRLVFDEIARRELFFLDSITSAGSLGYSLGQEMGLPVLKRDVFLDRTISVSAVSARLAELESVARANGYAIAIGHPHDVTLDMIEKWIPHARSAGLRFVTARELLRELTSKYVASLPAPGG